MKKLLTILILLISSPSVFAQYGKINKQIAEEIISKETTIVLSDTDQVYNKLLEQVIKENWTISKYVFKKESELTNVNGVFNKYHDKNKAYLRLWEEDYGYGKANYMTLSIGGSSTYFYQLINASKLINDVDQFKKDKGQILLAINVIQNHVNEGLNNNANIKNYAKSVAHYQNDEFTLSNGKVLIINKDLVENSYQDSTDKFTGELKKITDAIETLTKFNLKIINQDEFEKSKSECKYYLERQQYTGPILFVLYDIETSKIVNVYNTKNGRAPYFEMYWKKAVKALLK